MEFKGPYLKAMSEQAPKMFMQMRRLGTLEEHLAQKCAEAERMFDELTKDAPKLPNGLPEQPHRSRAESLVLETLIEFPSEDPEPLDPLGR